MCFLTSNPVNTIISRKATGAGIAPLSGDQKNDIESKLNGRGRYGAGMGKAGDVIATNETLERLDLTRDNKKLQTIEMQENAKENIRNRYLIPKDFFGGSTYENQQFAEAKFILGNVKTITDNWLQELTNKSPKYFKERGTRLIGTYDHLPSVIAIKILFDTPGTIPSSCRKMKGIQSARKKIESSVRTMTSTAALPVGTPAWRRNMTCATAPPVAPGVRSARK